MDMNNGIYIETPKIHHTVFERIIENPGYAPTALNRPYKIVDDKGTFVKDSQIGKMVPDFEESAHVGTQQNPLDTLGRFNPYLENAWDKVWWKRLVYFTHLTFLSCLLAGPWILDFVNITNDETKSCKDRICSLTEPLNALQSGIEEFLPFGMNIEPWIKTAQQYQGWTIFFALVWGVLFWLGERQKTLVNTTLAHYWLGLAGVEDKPKKVPEKSNLYKIRTSNKYRYCFDVLKRYCMTWLWAIAIIVGLVLAVNKTGVFLRDHTVQSLALCPAPSNKYESAKIDISKVCNDTLANVIEGATYQIRVEPDEGCRIDQDNEAEPWRTAGVAASPSGVNKDKVYLLSRLWRKPLQRTNSVRLFSPILQIGSRYPTETIVHFNEAYSSSYNKAFWISRFTAPQTGRAYFYANDSIISALPSSLQFIQKRNCGTGQITIKPI